MAKLEIKLVKSVIGSTKDQRATVAALGLKKLNSVAIQDDNEAVRGQINKVQHLLEVKEI